MQPSACTACSSVRGRQALCWDERLNSGHSRSSRHTHLADDLVAGLALQVGDEAHLCG